MLFARLFSIISVTLVFHLTALAQLDKFQRPAVISDLLTVYTYQKSNWDGSHASTIYLYVADSNELQSFKWAKGDKVATLVTAQLDWTNFSIRRFTNHRLRSGQAPQLIATLWMGGERKIAIQVGSMNDSMLLTELPWQSYDFDFAGLGFIWRALRDKKSSFHFHIADAALVNGSVAFVNKGRAEVNYFGIETIKGKSCLKYTIDGAGLENKGGHIWINPETFMIEQYKIALPDEEGFENGMLRLVSTQKMSPGEWTSFMKERLEE